MHLLAKTQLDLPRNSLPEYPWYYLPASYHLHVGLSLGVLATVGFALYMFHRLAPAPTWWSPSCKELEIQQSSVAETTARVALDANSEDQRQD